MQKRRQKTLKNVIAHDSLLLHTAQVINFLELAGAPKHATLLKFEVAETNVRVTWLE